MYPLRDSVFEATPVKVPFQYAWLLEQEYGKESLKRMEFEKLAHLCSTLVCSTLLTMTQPLGIAGMRRLWNGNLWSLSFPPQSRPVLVLLIFVPDIARFSVRD